MCFFFIWWRLWKSWNISIKLWTSIRNCFKLTLEIYFETYKKIENHEINSCIHGIDYYKIITLILTFAATWWLWLVFIKTLHLLTIDCRNSTTFYLFCSWNATVHVHLTCTFAWFHINLCWIWNVLFSLEPHPNLTEITIWKTETFIVHAVLMLKLFLIFSMINHFNWLPSLYRLQCHHIYFERLFDYSRLF